MTCANSVLGLQLVHSRSVFADANRFFWRALTRLWWTGTKPFTWAGPAHPSNSRIHRDDAGAIKICFFTGIRFYEAVRVTPKQNKGFENKWKRKKCAYRGIETTILRNKLILGTRLNMARGTLFGGTDHANLTIDVVVRILKTYRDNEKELQMIHEDWHDTTENNGRVSVARTAGALHRAK